MNQIDLNNAVGKTITDIYRFGESQCVVLFSDNTFSKIEGSGDEDWNGLDTFASFCFMYRYDLWPLFLDRGLITQAQIDAKLAASAVREEQERGYRRAQFENLKKEFGNE